MKRIDAINEVPNKPVVVEEFGKWIYAVWTPGSLPLIQRSFLTGCGWRNYDPTCGEGLGKAASAVWEKAPLATTVLRLAKLVAEKPAESEVESYAQHCEWEGVTV